MRRFFAAVAIYLLSVTVALAQSSPGFFNGQVPSAAQWNAIIGGKADTNNGALNGPTIGSSAFRTTGISAYSFTLGGNAGAGTASSPFTNTDNTAGIATQISTITTRGGALQLPAAQYNLTSASGIPAGVNGLAIEGSSLGATVDPNGSVDGNFGTKFAMNGSGNSAITYNVNSSPIQGTLLAKIYAYGTGETDGSKAVDVEGPSSGSDRLGQPRFLDLEFANVEYGFYQNGWMDGPYVSRYSCLYCGYGYYYPASTEGSQYGEFTELQLADDSLSGYYNASGAGGEILANSIFVRNGYASSSPAAHPSNVYFSGNFGLLTNSVVVFAGYNYLTSTQVAADGAVLGGSFGVVSNSIFENNGGTGGAAGYDVHLLGTAQYNVIQNDLFYDTTNTASVLLDSGAHGNVLFDMIPTSVVNNSGASNYLFYNDNATHTIMVKGFPGNGTSHYSAMSFKTDTAAAFPYGTGIDFDATSITSGRDWALFSTGGSAPVPGEFQINDQSAGGATRFAITNQGYVNLQVGMNVGAPTGSTGSGQINVATSYEVNGTAGVACSGTPTSSFASVGGIVTHC